ncbi:phenylacetic acid degradation b [Adhaeribacter rhizoryzae]|uniref:Phenylacetic acid degradation b n=1 Tax=Adhaeribacter rhizoryzae TaxID=2607907 RepID=A0A5M6D6Y8_9BACT|nr:phenylacetic acid degradation b [Adhaeribacter rhizoryzae]KAA5542436.1 phenylacetic acid degradation b [Adhaeribacter rhizoryzae]
MLLTSLDPRINRLQVPADWPNSAVKKQLDQWATYEVFTQKRENTPYAYVGPVHAPDLEVAFVFAKEQYSRRAACFGLWVVKTQDIQHTPYVDDNESVFNLLNIPAPATASEQSEAFEIFMLKKRGKAHTHAGTVLASGYQNALAQAKQQFGEQIPCVNIWVAPAAKILKSSEEDKDWWLTLNEKKYREPVAYKVLDKINAFKNRTTNTP